jgi:tetratricopeptide (TPR) repeat protein/tRNA A-37 threonylcarbamoyl transferase component Bud32
MAVPGVERVMLADDFSRIEALFAELVQLEPATRASALDSSCADRPDLRDELEALLHAHDRIGSGDTFDNDDPARPPIGVDSQLGAFRLLEKIGEGGMGAVFRAERTDGAFIQQVAVKVMRSTIGDADLLHRFRVERQILASLRHPNIVTLLDGGATPDGQAYLAMELVDGAEIVRHCRAQELPLKDRLRLFCTLCEAVQYAHQRGVVHRDLKPANVLVGSDGALKVLDFGVAKLLLAPSDGATTRGPLPGPLTPNYASPEQLRGLPVTTASDVYSLGILLYELVTDVRPYDTDGLTLDRVLEIVVHTEPPRPSAIGSYRSLRGDVDAIVLKAISKSAVDRYDTAGELGSDVARFLAGEPVLARGPSAGYVLRRLAARNKTLVGVSALALMAIVTTSAVALWQRQIARREQARAEQRFREVRQLANALIFKIHDAVAPLAGSTPVRRTIVDEALAYLEHLERESGSNDVTLRLELAAAYRQIGGILGDPQRPNLGDRDGAVRQYERARAIVLPLATDTAPYDVVNALSRVDGALSTLYNLRNDPVRSIAIAREALDHAARYRQQHPADSRGLQTLAATSFQLAWTSPRTEQVALWTTALEHYDRVLAERSASAEAQRNVALVEKYLATVLPVNQSEPHHMRAVELDEKRLAAAPDDRQAQLDTAISLAGLARVVEQKGDLDQTRGLLERSLAIRRRLADTDPANVHVRDRLGSVLSDVARVHRKRGDVSSAKARGEEAVRVLESVLEVTKDRATQERLAYAWFELGHVESAAHDRAASCRAFRRSNEMYRLRALTDVEPAVKDQAARAAAACR